MTAVPSSRRYLRVDAVRLWLCSAQGEDIAPSQRENRREPTSAYSARRTDPVVLLDSAKGSCPPGVTILGGRSRRPGRRAPARPRRPLFLRFRRAAKTSRPRGGTFFGVVPRRARRPRDLLVASRLAHAHASMSRRGVPSRARAREPCPVIVSPRSGRRRVVLPGHTRPACGQESRFIPPRRSPLPRRPTRGCVSAAAERAERSAGSRRPSLTLARRRAHGSSRS